MKYLLYIASILIACIIPIQSFAIDAKVSSAYTQLLTKLEQKYSLDMQETILKDLHNRLESFSENTSKTTLISIVDDLQSLNNEKLYDIWLKNELSPVNQKVQELREISAFKALLTNRTLPSYVSDILSSNIRYIKTDDKRQFTENNEIKRIVYSSYIPVSQSNAPRLKNKSGIIIYDQASGYRFIETYSFETKIPYSQLASRFEVYLTNNHKISTTQESIYAYNFLNFRFFQDKYGAYESDLNTSGFSYDTTLLYKREDGGYNFVTDYSKYRVADTDIVYGVPEKHLFLEYLREDAKFETTDISSQLAAIRNISDSLTAGKTREASIKAIYAWILDNVEYTRVIDLSDEKIFSGIETFKNNEGVCTGYTKLSSYLFYFAGYHDVEVIKGHVIDAQDFPQIGHAWLKIGDLYYDPTFDDPIGAQNTRKPSDYKYFGLPKDIFYANRYEYGDLPEHLNTASDREIREHIFKKLTNLIPKYQNSLDEYPVFAGVAFRNTYNISSSETITPDLLAAKIGNYTVENNSFRFMDDTGTQRQILGFNYYPLTSENTSSVLDILGYDTSEIRLFNWQKSSGEYEWRLAYDLELR